MIAQEDRDRIDDLVSALAPTIEDDEYIVVVATEHRCRCGCERRIMSFSITDMTDLPPSPEVAQAVVEKRARGVPVVIVDDVEETIGVIHVEFLPTVTSPGGDA